MPADPLFFDLRLALENARPIQKILSDVLREEGELTSSLTHAQRVLVDAGLAEMIQSVYSAAENLQRRVGRPGAAPPVE